MALTGLPALAGPTPPVGTTARWLRRVATTLTAPLGDSRADSPCRVASATGGLPLVGDGLPVLLIGGLASTPHALAPLRDWLDRSGCTAAVTAIRYGLDCGERTAQRVAHDLYDLAEATGRRCAVVAHSRGGQVGRTVAVRHPDLVAGLVTLGSPLNRMLGIHPLLRAEVAVLGVAGSLGVPGLLRGACLWGACCRDFRTDLAAPWPADVPFVSVFSRRDRLVDWRSSLDPSARHREVDTSHGGLLHAPAARAVLAAELQELAAPRLRAAA